MCPLRWYRQHRPRPTQVGRTQGLRGLVSPSAHHLAEAPVPRDPVAAAARINSESQREIDLLLADASN
jgi:hypothetical protein